MANVNSFTETTNDLVKQVNIALESMAKMNQSMTTENDSVIITVEGNDPITGDSSTYTYSIPSYQYTMAELSRITNTVDTFVSGNGVVLLNDGTYRQVSTIPVAKAPTKITSVAAPTKFQTKSNWFFESMLFPILYVQFNLKGKIDDRSDRVVVKRVIFDNYDDTETQWFKTNVIGTTWTYYDLTTFLNENNKNYWEDQETKDLPLKTRKYRGNFKIINKGVISGEEWYYLDTINYGLVTDSSTVNNIELKIGDTLRFNNSLFDIQSIQVTEKRVNLVSKVGLGAPVINSSFDIYSTPFQDKYVDIPIGYNECQSIFIKGVNDDYNIIADEWSDSISFYSNDLTLINSVQSLETYYFNYVSDFGKTFEGQAKEKFVPAFFGVNPDAPTITAEQFGVKQINTQINASLDTESVKNTQTQIESTKTIIESLKTTIAQQKAELVELTDPGQRADLQAKIDNNTSQLSKKTVEYQSLVKSLATLAYENSAVSGSPKYRVRGFFDIPAGKRTTNDPSEDPQEVIQFDVAYRYLRLDNTGNPLNTFSYPDPCTGQQITGTFTDWIITSSPIKKRQYDASAGIYKWVDESVSDGEAVNINQVDIPITKGEKVQLRIRSISEAGWPTNPLKSDWSNTVTIEFPNNLQGSDQVTNILADSQAEETTIKLQETLNAAGVYTHLNDSVPNPNAADGTYFKHQAQYLAYDLPKKDAFGIITSESTVDLQSQLDNLASRTFVTILNPDPAAITGLPSSLTGTLQQLLTAIVTSDPSIYIEFYEQLGY